jgi:hypothetical protein
MQNPDATRVAGFKAWLALGYCVRRGENALRIFAPCPPSKAKLQAWRDAGADPAEKPRTFFRLTAVFDTSSRDRLGGFSRDAVARLKTLDRRNAAARLSPGTRTGLSGEARGRRDARTHPVVRERAAQALAGRARHRRAGDAPAAAALRATADPLRLAKVWLVVHSSRRPINGSSVAITERRLCARRRDTRTRDLAFEARTKRDPSLPRQVAVCIGRAPRVGRRCAPGFHRIRGRYRSWSRRRVR